LIALGLPVAQKADLFHAGARGCHDFDPRRLFEAQTSPAALFAHLIAQRGVGNSGQKPVMLPS
jgi:hypothetical protein